MDIPDRYPRSTELKDVPGDVNFADEFLGQRIYIIPSKKLVVVRMGYSLKNFSVNDFLRDIIETLPVNQIGI